MVNVNLGIAITMGKGVQFKFPNGWTVSIQIGASNYCDRYSLPTDSDFKYNEFITSSNAEIAAWDSRGNWLPFKESGANVLGYVPVMKVLEFINMIAAK